MPSDFSSKGREIPVGDKAGVLLNDKYEKQELSTLTPPVSTASHSPSSSSCIAILIALRLLAQAASTTQFVPPKLNLLAIRPETMLAK